MQNFFKHYPSEKLAPLHIAVEKGSLQICEEIIAKSTNKNPHGAIGKDILKYAQDTLH